jgi:hypothetical protein
MSEALSIDALRKRHEILYAKATERLNSARLSPDEHRELLHEMEKLLEDFIKIYPHVEPAEDYIWLQDAAGKWDTVKSSLLKQRNTIRLLMSGHIC